MNVFRLNVIADSRGEFLAYLSKDEGPKFHASIKYARTYRTLKGARVAATRWRNLYGRPLAAKLVNLVPE